MMVLFIYKNILIAYKKEAVCHMIVKKMFYNHKTRYMALFMVVLTVNWFAVTSFVPLVEAANSLVDIELFTNQQTSNISHPQSTYESPLVFSSEKTSHDVDFIVTGQSLAHVEVLNGTQQVILTIPDDLVGHIKPNGSAKVEVDVLLSEDAPLLGGLLGGVLKAVKALLDGLGKILGLIPILGSLINRLTSILDKLFNLGRLHYEADISDMGTYFVVDYQTGLIAAILSNLIGLLKEILGIVTDIKNIPLIGTLLGLALLNNLENAVNNTLDVLEENLLNPTGEVVDELLTTSVLSNTKVTFPTTIYDPGVELFGDDNGVVPEYFVMRIVQTDVIDLDLFKGAENSGTIVYLQGKKTESQLSLAFPDNLNFGQHTIQTTKPEIWVATETGEQTAPLTTGNLHLIDTSNQSKNWQIKVRQQTNWVNNTNELIDAILNMYGGELVIDGFSDDSVINGFSNGPIRLMTGEEKEVLSLNQTNQRGSIKLGIDTFELHVPKNIEKKQGEYEANFIWTASDTP